MVARKRGSGRGGYQQPSSPRPPGGPGKFSQRTDAPGSGQMGQGLGYGENKAVNDLAAAAPMQSPQGGPSGGAPTSGRATRGPNGIFGPSDRPGEPLTAGIDFGPGSGRVDGPVLPDDPHQLIRALAVASGDRDIVRLALRNSGG